MFCIFVFIDWMLMFLYKRLHHKQVIVCINMHTLLIPPPLFFIFICFIGTYHASNMPKMMAVFGFGVSVAQYLGFMCYIISICHEKNI